MIHLLKPVLLHPIAIDMVGQYWLLRVIEIWLSEFLKLCAKTSIFWRLILEVTIPNFEQPNPLLPGYQFNAYLVAGLTPIDAEGEFDFFIDRPNGMKGYIINLTIKGKGLIIDSETSFTCTRGDLLLFAPKQKHYYGRSEDSDCWHHRWIYFKPRAYWIDWLKWHSKTGEIGKMSLTDPNLIEEFEGLICEIERIQKSGRRFSEALAMNQLELLLLRAMEEDPLSPQKILDARVVEACDFIAQNLSAELTIQDIAKHVCLSPSRIAHLFREQVGVNILRWREDQRLSRAKLLLQTTQQSIASIASNVGYDDQLYFSRIFHKNIGVSPTDFRKEMTELHIPDA